MLEPRFRWIRPADGEVSPSVAAAVEAVGAHPRIASLLERRGCRDGAAVRRFVGPAAGGLHDPFLLPGSPAAAARIEAARSRGERVMVVGDFDADGLTGLAILVRALRAAGLRGRAYIPDRADEGHGLSVRAVDAARAAGCALILTVDCGTSSPREVDLARSAGMDVIVTDHHHVPADAAAPLALVSPMVDPSEYPFPHLTGAGVALKVAQLVLSDAADDALELADLAAIGTVADVAPLLGENRSIVRLGLDRIRSGSRPGIAALADRAGLAVDRIDAEAIGFALAPRLNAAGRIGDARIAARLLLTDDPDEARTLAAELETWNSTRRDVTAEVFADASAMAQAAADDPAVIVAGPWPVGIIGLVAGRLAESLNRPAVVFSTVVEPWRGSARSPSMDLAAAFASCSGHFVRFGGHAQAAGCDLASGRYEAFREAFLSLAADAPAPGPPTLLVDLEVRPDELDYALHEALRLLEPTGTGNPPPLICVRGATVRRARGVHGGHSQLTLAKGREVIDGIAFGRADLADSVGHGATVDLVGRLGTRRFGGFESLQVEVLDIALPAAGDGPGAAHFSTAAPVAAGANGPRTGLGLAKDAGR